MKPPVDDTRRQLGELGAMQEQCARIDHKILERAEQLLAEVERKLPELRAGALAHEPVAMQSYQDLIAERGRLQQVIAQAQQDTAPAN